MSLFIIFDGCKGTANAAKAVSVTLRVVSFALFFHFFYDADALFCGKMTIFATKLKQKNIMYKVLHIIVLSILLLNGNDYCQAQTTRFFPCDDYLESSVVNDLLQDSLGVIWIATQGGLTKYDSHQFHTYRHDGKSGTLIGNDVRRLTEENDGNLIIGTTTGVQRFSPTTLQFSDIHLFSGNQERNRCYINSILARRNGEVLIATSGVGLFVMKQGANEARYSDLLMYDELLDVKDLTETPDGSLWVAAGEYGILNIKKGKLHTYQIEGKQAIHICKDKSNHIYASSFIGGIFRYDAGNDKFVCVDNTRNLPVNRLTSGNNGDIIIATDGKGLWRLSDEGVLKPCALNERTIEGSRAKVGIAIEDHDGNLWVGINQHGLLMSSRQSNPFEYIGIRSTEKNWIGHHSVSAIYQDADGMLWVGTDGDGLYCISPDGKSRHYTNVPDNILCICEDKQHQLYIASWLGGCGQLNRKTGQYKQFDFTKQGDAIHVMSILADDTNHLWLATNGDGLKCLDLNTGHLTEYDAITAAAPSGLENALSNAWVGYLSLSPDGKRLYFAMSSGVGCLDLQSRSFVSTFGRNHLLAGLAVYAVREGKDGSVWVATSDGLYNVNRKKNNEMKRLSTSDGLPTNEIVSLEFGNDGQLWMGTHHGLCTLNQITGTCANYFKTDGVQGNEFGKASAHFTDGRLAFGGSGGLTLFYPKDVLAPASEMRVRLVGMTVGGREVSALTRSGWYQVTDTCVSATSHFHLAYYDNSFTLSFSAMDYIRADGIHYEYTTGDDQWQAMPMGINTLTMSHLAPGTYKMLVRAVSGSNMSAPLTFTIEVHPAWYASTLAKFIYVLVAILLLWRYLARRRRAEQQRLRVQEHIHAAQMREEEEDKAKVEQAVDKLIDQQPVIQTPDERLMERVIQVINRHLSDSDLSVEQIANEVGMNRSHLHRKMKEMTGESISGFVRNVRLKRAAFLLEGGRHSIAEVMYACGFDNPSGFSTRFKHFYGVSPSEYMKEHSYSNNDMT